MKIQKNIVLAILAVAIFSGASFYGGMKYEQSKADVFRNRTFGDRPGINGQLGGVRPNGQPNQGFLSGEILAKDNQSLTLKLRDGGSRIIFFASSTEVGKFINGLIDDLKIGDSIVVNGKQNSDGSLTAQNIQLRPQVSP